MKNRCNNPNEPRYSDYGGRGITVCQEWLDDFMNFYNWAMENGYSDELSIDRINNDKGYSPDNCRWSTKKEQANNTRTSHNITYKGQTKTLTEWSEILGLSFHLLSNRINKYGWSIERAFETPKSNRGRKCKR